MSLCEGISSSVVVGHNTDSGAPPNSRPTKTNAVAGRASAAPRTPPLAWRGCHDLPQPRWYDNRTAGDDLHEGLQLHRRHLVHRPRSTSEACGSGGRCCGLLRRLTTAGPRRRSTRADGGRDHPASSAAPLPGQGRKPIMSICMHSQAQPPSVQTDCVQTGLWQLCLTVKLTHSSLIGRVGTGNDYCVVLSCPREQSTVQATT